MLICDLIKICLIHGVSGHFYPQCQSFRAPCRTVGLVAVAFALDLPLFVARASLSVGSTSIALLPSAWLHNLLYSWGNYQPWIAMACSPQLCPKSYWNSAKDSNASRRSVLGRIHGIPVRLSVVCVDRRPAIHFGAFDPTSGDLAASTNSHSHSSEPYLPNLSKSAFVIGWIPYII